ncbi:hypothetical protein QBC35DRAFT_468190 [Podospora australis]|uniref:Uncharacterized protein n=1 Tax=Podospora australis TaxID=1536484 RepID=A0AAN6WI75_9PEZI|nr:hypothetical protein QBC35DRAFT_468190 [Podospora australis]
MPPGKDKQAGEVSVNAQGDPTSKHDAKKLQAQEDYQARKEHSKSGANTGKSQGMEYVPRKDTATEVPHNN